LPLELDVEEEAVVEGTATSSMAFFGCGEELSPSSSSSSASEVV